MNNRNKDDNYFDDDNDDWDTGFEFEEKQADKQRSCDKKASRKREIRERLEDHFEKRKLRAQNRFIVDYANDSYTF